MLATRAAQAVDAAVCASCHPREAAAYAATPMGRSIADPEPVDGGEVIHGRSGAVVRVRQTGGHLTHELQEKGLTAAYQIAYQIGAGKLARSYLVQIQGYLFESPVTWYRATGWDVSPGYQSAAVIDFDRPVKATCLFCHAERLADGKLTAIGCERCHGPGEAHVRHPSAANIVNPGKLTGRPRDSVCEQCHLEGEVRVLNPGKEWRDFRPGEDFVSTASTYVFKQDNRDATPVSQVEQLAESQCAARSGGGLWCGSCHSAHGAKRDTREVCSSCHPNLSRVAHPRGGSDCVTCHMPKLPSTYTHVAVTDHRIPRRAGRRAVGVARELAAWAEPPSGIRERNLAIAYLEVGLRERRPDLARKGMELAGASSGDGALLSAICDATGALPACREAARLQPRSADQAMALGSALAKSGDLAGAEQALRAAIALDPSLKHAYAELWNVYDRQSRRAEMLGVKDAYLRWNPGNIMFRVLERNLAAEDLLANLPFLLHP